MKRPVLKAALISFLLLFPIIAHAGTMAGTYELSPFLGYYDMRQGDRFGGGLRLGYNLTNAWGLEAAYDRAGSVGDLYHADILYNFRNFMPDGKLTPFAFAGAGLVHVSPDSYNSALGEIGVGLKYAINDFIGLRIDIRDMQEKYNDVVTTAGLTFTFGGKKQAVVEQTPPPPPAIEPVPKPEVAPPPAPKTEEKPQPAEKAVEKERLEFKILFDFDKYNIRPEYAPVIEKIAAILKKEPRCDGRDSGLHGPYRYGRIQSEAFRKTGQQCETCPCRKIRHRCVEDYGKGIW